jgi:hypothetical protein
LRLRFLTVALAGAILLGLPPATGAGEGAESSDGVCRSFRVRPQDQVWLVSTRHLGCTVGEQYDPPLQYWQYERGLWQPRTAAEFFAADSADIITPVYVHGNRIDAGLAGSYGLWVYFELVGKLDAEPPVRFVLWSWPSDQIRGPLNDVRAKAERSDIDGWYLGCFLARLRPEVRVGLVGYSFGARIASGAVDLIGGGSLWGQSLPAGKRPSVRVVLWAAAEDNTWYLPNQFHGHALAAAEAWFITLNYCDPVLSRYRFIDRCSNPEAVGCVGIYGRNLLPSDVNRRIEEVNVSNIVGDEHNWRPYLYSLYIQGRTREYMLWHDASQPLPREPASVAAAR